MAGAASLAGESVDLGQGARNLLSRAALLAPGERVLIVEEDPTLGWYDAAAPEAVAREARRLGASVRRIEVGAPGTPMPDALAAAIDWADVLVFMARLGDQGRFENRYPGKRALMCYAGTKALLGSSYGRTDHQAMLALKRAVDGVLSGAAEIEITCPLGTHVTGRATPEPAADVTMVRFPLGMPSPVLAEGFSGRVVLAQALTPTGSAVYTPACLELAEPVVAEIAAGRIAGFDGPDPQVAAVKAHYAQVAKTLGIDARAVHSWHPGLHPGLAYPHPAKADWDRWSNTVFTSPQALHFHTCGAYAPGEICWMVLWPTVRVDGSALWSKGRLCPEACEATRAVIAAWPALGALFAEPLAPLGLDGASPGPWQRPPISPPASPTTSSD